MCCGFYITLDTCSHTSVHLFPNHVLENMMVSSDSKKILFIVCNVGMETN